MSILTNPSNDLTIPYESRLAERAIRQNATLIVLTTAANWAQPLEEWCDPYLHPISASQLSTLPVLKLHRKRTK